MYHTLTFEIIITCKSYLTEKQEFQGPYIPARFLKIGKLNEEKERRGKNLI